MSIKSKLVLQLVVVLYLLVVTLLYKLNIINPANFITILILQFIEIIMWYILWLNEKRLSGITDELVISILSKVNKIGMNFLVISMLYSASYLQLHFIHVIRSLLFQMLQ